MVFTEATFSTCLSKIRDLNAILFFQQNFGLATEMADKIKQSIEYDESVVIDFQDNEKNFATSLREQLCDGFFSTKKIIKVYNFKLNGRSKIKDELNFLNEENFSDKIVLFFAPELDGKSSVKTFFEKGGFTASIACYEDDENVAIRCVNEFFNDKGIKISQQAVKIMAEMLHGDRKMLISECEKMTLYCSGREIEVDDVNVAIISGQTANPSLFIDYLLSGDIKSALRELQLLEHEDIQMISLMRIFIKSIEEIIDIKYNAEKVGVDIAIKMKFIFWKRVFFVKNAVMKLTNIMLDNYIKIALKTETMAKIYGNDIAKHYFVRNAILFSVK